MALPGLLVEYLVIGAVALLWALPLVTNELCVEKFPLEWVVAVVPIIYVLGMFVDFISFIIVTWLPCRNGSYKTRVRAIVEKKLDGTESGYAIYLRIVWGGFCGLEKTHHNEFPGPTVRRQIRLVAEKPELAKQIEVRSGRDRIARCTVINLALIGFVLLESQPKLAVASFVLTAVAIPMWIFFESNSYGYERQAEKQLYR